jgi:hypothetical protein
MEIFDMEKYEKITKYTVNRQWGIYIWGAIHEVAMGFPEIPNEANREHYAQFYEMLFKVLPCPICKEDFKSIEELYPIDLTDRDSLFKWTVDIHNAVNGKTGGFIWTVDEARKQWCSTYHELRFKN